RSSRLIDRRSKAFWPRERREQRSIGRCDPPLDDRGPSCGESAVTEGTPSTPPVEELLSVAQQAARVSGGILREAFDKQRTIEFKGGIDLVTDADRTSEAELIRYVRGRFPDHSILAEESGLSGGSGLRWIIDPLDGTTNYSHRVPMFCVSIAVDSTEGLLAGGGFGPFRGGRVSGGRGGGAKRNRRAGRA